MRLNEIIYNDAIPIDGYGPGFFRIGGQVFEGPLTVLSGQVATWGGYEDQGALIAVASILDVVFVGTGADIAHLPPAFRTSLEKAGLNAEPMASPAACRTYNILQSEGRRVGLALFPI